MKKIFMTGMALVVSLAMLTTSCHKDETNNNGNNNGNTENPSGGGSGDSGSGGSSGGGSGTPNQEYPSTAVVLPQAVTDIDGNSYDAVQIGSQVWMAENMRTTRYADGTTIPMGSINSGSNPYRYVPGLNHSNEENMDNVSRYGYLYNWPAVMHGSRSSRRNPSGVQGICPDGWHVPSDAEWTELTDYVGSRSEYSCCGNDNYIAKALSATKGWKTAKEEEWAWSNDTCMVGNDQYTNNSTGFSALPSGNHIGERYCNFGSHAFFWTTTKSRENKVYYRDIGYEYVLMVRDEDFQFVGYSVRCVRD